MYVWNSLEGFMLSFATLVVACFTTSFQLAARARGVYRGRSPPLCDPGWVIYIASCSGGKWRRAGDELSNNGRDKSKKRGFTL